MASPAFPVQPMYVQPHTTTFPFQQPYYVQQIYENPPPTQQQQVTPNKNNRGCQPCMLWCFWFLWVILLLDPLTEHYTCILVYDFVVYTSGILAVLVPQTVYNNYYRTKPNTLPANEPIIPAVVTDPKMPGISTATQTQNINFEEADSFYNATTSNSSSLRHEMRSTNNYDTAPPPYEGY